MHYCEYDGGLQSTWSNRTWCGIQARLVSGSGVKVVRGPDTDRRLGKMPLIPRVPGSPE